VLLCLTRIVVGRVLVETEEVFVGVVLVVADRQRVLGGLERVGTLVDLVLLAHAELLVAVLDESLFLQ